MSEHLILQGDSGFLGRYVALKGLHGELRDATDRVETLKKCEDSRKNKPEKEKIGSLGKRSATTDQPTKGLHEEGTTDVGKSRRKGEKKPRRV